MKKTGYAALTLMAALLIGTLTGCSSAEEEDAPDGMKLASPEGVDYTLYVPEAWKVDTKADSILTEAHVEDGDNSNITMITYANDGGFDSIPGYWEQYAARLPGIFDADAEGKSTYKLLTVGGTDKDGKPLPDGEEAKLDGEDCRVYRYEGNMGEVPLRFMQVIAYHEGDFYIFTYTATTENDRYGRNEEDVARILNEFRFKD